MWHPPPSKLITLTLVLVLGWPLVAQQQAQVADATVAANIAGAAGTDLVKLTLPLDISGADYYALVAWAQRLGLTATGTAADLRNRLYAHYGVNAPPPPEVASRVITIASADSSEYLTAREDGDAIIRLTGRIKVLMVDSAAGEKLSIEADELMVNRDANILFARGDITLERIKPDGAEYFYGQIIEFDMDDWSGLFVDGRSVHGQQSATKMIFRARQMARPGGSVLVFDDGEITSSLEEYPHYSIRAARIWILGPNEWAMSSATLSVGEVPVLWLPFFFYPGEEIVFHPVFGYRDREGRLVQTTTYLLGAHKPKEQSISLFKLTEGAGNYEKVVEGVFLRTTNQKKTSATADHIKIMADVYSNLGVFGGAQLKLATLGPFKPFDASIGLGISRSVFAGAGSMYTPFAQVADFQSVWNLIDYSGLELPFRFGLDLTARLAMGPLSLSIVLPFYSDPFFDKDFRNRSEHMDWLKFLKQEQNPSPPAERSAFVDRIDAQLAVPASSLPAWLGTLSLSRLSTSLAWTARTRTRTEDPLLYNADPARKFFVPDQWTILDVTANLGGTLLKYPQPAATSSRPAAPTAAAPATGQATTAPAAGSAAPAAAPAQAGRTAASAQAASTQAGLAAGPAGVDGLSAGGTGAIADPLVLALATLPDARQPWETPGQPQRPPVTQSYDFTAPGLLAGERIQSREPLSATLTWTASPLAKWDHRFMSTVNRPVDFDLFDTQYQTIAFRTNGALNLTANLYGGFVGIAAGLTGQTQYQWRPLADDSSASLLQSWILQDARYRSDRLAATFRLNGVPFQDQWLLAPTRVAYTINSTIYEYKFIKMQADKVTPEYDALWLDWSRDRITAHNLSFTLGLQPFGFVQTLNLQADLPPLTEGYAIRLDMKVPGASLGLQTKYGRPKADADFRWNPLTISGSLGGTPGPVLSGNFIWNIESAAAQTASAKLSWTGFSIELAARQAAMQEFKEAVGWNPVGAETFMPASLQVIYRNSWKPDPVWRNRMAWTIDAGVDIRQSFIRFADSSMDFNLGFTFKIHEFLDIKFASVSRNSALWRYYAGIFGDVVPVSARKPVNPVEDILKSFNFADITDRQNALFKLKSLSVKLEHDLRDWDLSAELSLVPQKVNNEFTFKPSFSLSLAWRAVPEFKSSYRKDGDKETW
jgi:hypothetical protein